MISKTIKKPSYFVRNRKMQPLLIVVMREIKRIKCVKTRWHKHLNIISLTCVTVTNSVYFGRFLAPERIFELTVDDDDNDDVEDKDDKNNDGKDDPANSTVAPLTSSAGPPKMSPTELNITCFAAGMNPEPSMSIWVNGMYVLYSIVNLRIYNIFLVIIFNLEAFFWSG